MRIARMMIQGCLTALSIGLLCETAQAAEMRGAIHDAETGQGIPSLTVKLVPSKPHAVEKIALTNGAGEFRLGDLEKGSYVLEVYQGATQIERDAIEVTEGVVTRDISLHRAPKKP